MKNRALRRHHNKRILQKRKNLLKCKYKRWYNNMIEYCKPGYMRKSLYVYSCSCGLHNNRSVSFLMNFKEKEIIGEYDECNFKEQTERNL